MCEPQNRENLHRLFWFSMLYRNRSGVVELVISREGSLADVRESRERRDKIFAEKTENAPTAKTRMRNSSFQWGVFNFLAAEKLPFLEGGITSKLASQCQ